MFKCSSKVTEMSFFLCLLQISPTECFLRYLQLPDNDSVAVDLKQAAVVIMSHLDRLAAPHAPPATFSKVSYCIVFYFKGNNMTRFLLENLS